MERDKAFLVGMWGKRRLLGIKKGEPLSRLVRRSVFKYVLVF